MIQFFRKIYLSLYLKGLRELENEQRLQHIDLPSSSGHISVSFSFFRVAQPEARLSAGCYFLYSIISPTLWSSNSLNFLCTQLYYSSTPTQSLPITGHRNMHFCRLWNGMFDRHRAEITVMQFTGHPLPVHQFVTVPWDFNPVPYSQPSSPTPMEYATSAVFGKAYLAGSEVNIKQIEETSYLRKCHWRSWNSFKNS